MSVTGLNMKIELKNRAPLHHPHKQKKYLIQFRSNGSNKIPIKTSRQKRSFQASTVPSHLAIRCISRRRLGHCWIQWPRGQKVPAVVIFPRSITSSQYTTPLQATLTSTSKHCISSSKLQAAWPFGGHGPTGVLVVLLVKMMECCGGPSSA